MRRQRKINPMQDQDLHALVDGEMSPAEKVALLDRLQRDHYRRAALCELRNLKEMIRTAYEDVPVPPLEDVPRPPRRGARNRVASIAAVIVAAVASLFAAGSGILPGEAERLVLLDPDGKGTRPAQAGDREMRIVFHVSGDDPEKSDEILREVEDMLATYGREGKKLRIEVVAHGQGLAMLRERLTTPQQRRKIAELSRRFPNLTFVACMNTVKRLKVEQGVVVHLLPEAIPIRSGVAYVVKRQQEGWIYIQV